MVAVVLALVGWGSYETYCRFKANALQDQLVAADTAEVPAIVQNMEPYRSWANRPLRSALREAQASKDARKELHLSLALLPVDASQIDYLYSRLLDAQPQEVPVIRDALVPHKDGLLNKLWAVIEAPGQGKESQRLRAAAALAKYDLESEKWTKAQAAVGDDLVTVSPVYLSLWLDALRPVRRKLLPQLSAVFRDAARQGVERSLATDILADYATDDATTLADLLMDADEKQFGVIFLRLKELGENGSALLKAEIEKRLPGDLPSSDEKREVLAIRQANAAAALLKMNQAEKVWRLLAFHPAPDDRNSADPRVRSYLIHRLSPLGAPAKAVIKRLDEEADLTVRRALILSLGEFKDKQLLPKVRRSLLPMLQAIYRSDTDAGLHASVEWLLRTWQQDAWLNQVNDEWKADEEERGQRFENIVKYAKGQTPQWYVNSQGQTMVAIPGPVEFTMGSPTSEKDHQEDEVQHKRKISRSFAIASKSVTLAEYRNLTKDDYELGEKYARYHDLPVVGVNWYMAANYCNSLSEEEGIPEDQWTYQLDGDDFTLKKNYLKLSGYRLPTEAEMEYVTRAQTVTSRYYGETEELLGHYAWYTKNSNELVQRVGLKKPNDFGFFDVQGNCYAWCQEAYQQNHQSDGDVVIEDSEGDLAVIATKGRDLRGGSFFNPASFVRSAFRNDFLVPTTRYYYVGFRVARTLSSSSLRASSRP